jgi:hypothetical protein
MIQGCGCEFIRAVGDKYANKFVPTQYQILNLMAVRNPAEEGAWLVCNLLFLLH